MSPLDVFPRPCMPIRWRCGRRAAAGAFLGGAVAVAVGDPSAGLAAGVVVLAGVVTAWVTPVLRRAARRAA